MLIQANCRRWIGLELKWDYIQMARQRIDEDKQVRLARAVKERLA